MDNNAMKQQAINAIRVLSMDAIQKANSGHPGIVLGTAPAAFELWDNHLRHNPNNPNWVNRDRFILGAGHGSMLIYSLLHLYGYEGMTTEEIESFRSVGSKTPGHPEFGHTIGIEATTGPLGQGFAMGVGMAMAETHLAAKFNTAEHKIIDNHVYVLSGDGCMMEGITSEAASLAGTLKLNKLIVIYDDNEITIEGDTDIAFTEDVSKRFDAYGWNVIEVQDGNNTMEISEALDQAKASTEKPTLIRMRTEIGYGSPLAGSEKTHGAPLGEENIAKTKAALGWPEDRAPFEIGEELTAYFETKREELQKQEDQWNALYEAWGKENPELKAEFEHDDTEEIKALLDDEDFFFIDKDQASRVSSGQMLNYLNGKFPNLFGGSADLAPSNNTELLDETWYSPENRGGKNIHFGVREHAMAAMANGMSLYGGLKVFCATFLVFSDYMRGAMRLSALMKQPVLYVLTHDSIGVGEDGPTHEPIEHLASLRAMPNMLVFRPADGRETAAGYWVAMTEQLPTSMALSRQNLPMLEGTGKNAVKGGYALNNVENPDIILLGAGSEVNLAVQAAEELAKEDIKARVVSVPCMELFDKQSQEYKESVLPKNVRARVAVEAATTAPWYKYVGLDGCVIGLDRFGDSGAGNVLFEKFGFTVDNVVAKAKECLDNLD